MAREKDTLRCLKAAVRGTGWRINQTAAFRQIGQLFVVGFLDSWRNADKVAMSLEAKPMAVDPLFWAIMDLEANGKEPLSFRAWGAFVCGSVPVAELNLTAPLPPPADAASMFVTWLDEQAREFANHYAANPFSTFVEANKNHRERGAYATTLICSLILEGRIGDARSLTEAIVSGRRRSVGTHVSEGKTFYQRALTWLDTHPA
ncbi:MAG TPA: hypothetical protein VIR34_08860 [Gemmatimonadaceae bacterium]